MRTKSQSMMAGSTFEASEASSDIEAPAESIKRKFEDLFSFQTARKID
jgi:hypothetical protein